ncbi:MAG: bifunctional precorrin-2 dehydrogenase/sirohydrochlorin ferrochelatase [Lachnospiraceae bacterium]|nr:bifunctional precorrin-2 dehydrogenase/sirohydrochlorin ferrochelatase [Lachnospiraceae bacterium]
MKNDHAFFPIFMDLTGRKITVIGAGTIAARRVKVLCDFGADVTVVAEEISDAIRELPVQIKEAHIAVPGMEQIDNDRFDLSTLMERSFLVLAATDNEKVNNYICGMAKHKGIPVNIASDHTKCDFYFPGIVQKDDMVVGVVGTGSNHKRVREIKEKIEEIL